MDRNISVSVMNVIINIEGYLGELDILFSTVNNKEEKIKYVSALGNILREINLNIVFPILEEYPDLDPDKAAPDSLGA